VNVTNGNKRRDPLSEGGNGKDDPVHIPLPLDIAKTAISTLRGAPMLMVLAMINAGCLIMVTYLVLTSAENSAKAEADLLRALENCMNRTSKSEMPPPFQGNTVELKPLKLLPQ
jgi:hypothetical protein